MLTIITPYFFFEISNVCLNLFCFWTSSHNLDISKVCKTFFGDKAIQTYFYTLYYIYHTCELLWLYHIFVYFSELNSCATELKSIKFWYLCWYSGPPAEMNIKWFSYLYFGPLLKWISNGFHTDTLAPCWNEYQMVFILLLWTPC